MGKSTRINRVLCPLCVGSGEVSPSLRALAEGLQTYSWAFVDVLPYLNAKTKGTASRRSKNAGGRRSGVKAISSARKKKRSKR